MQKSSRNSKKYLKFSNMKILINYQEILYHKFKEISIIHSKINYIIWTHYQNLRMNYWIVSINAEIEKKKSQRDTHNFEDESNIMKIFYQLSYIIGYKKIISFSLMVKNLENIFNENLNSVLIMISRRSAILT